MIRKFNHKDIKQILNIESNSFPKSAYNKFAFFCFSKLYRFSVYEKDEILGYIIFNAKDGHIISIAVDPQHRRKGIGRELMMGVFERCKKTWVEVRESNRGAQAFYTSLGFVKKRVIKNYYGDENAYLMVREAS